MFLSSALIGAGGGGGENGGFRKKITYVVFAGAVLTALSFVGTRIRSSLETANNDQEMINKYLLKQQNAESAAADFLHPKPKLWIHTKYEKNARKWDSFQSRCNKNSNQPFLNLTVETIVNHCRDDFDICLIDDESFGALLPDWKFNKKQQIEQIPDPMKSQLRQEGMLQLLFKYGGLVVPNSFVAFQNLKQLYDNVHTNGGIPVMLEMHPSAASASASASPSSVSSWSPSSYPFVPSTAFIGAQKEDPKIAQMIQVMEKIHSLQDNQPCDALGNNTWIQWCADQIRDHQIQLIPAQHIGCKTKRGLPVSLESLFQETPLDLDYKSDLLLGIYLPAEEILARTKYQWFCVLPKEDIFRSNAVIAKSILASLLESNDEHLSLARKRKNGNNNSASSPFSIRSAI